MPTESPTTEQFNNLIEFRQHVYEQGLTRERDAQFDLLDVLVTGQRVQSFVELSLSPLHRRQYSSIFPDRFRNGRSNNDFEALYDISKVIAGLKQRYEKDGSTVCGTKNQYSHIVKRMRIDAREPQAYSSTSGCRPEFSCHRTGIRLLDRKC